MKKTMFSCLFFLTTLVVYSQEKNEVSYRIISNPNNLNLDLYQEALNSSNFECFRFESKSRELSFTTGVVVELFSHNTVINSGVAQKNDCYLPDTATEIIYELNLVGNYIAIQAPYDKSIKRVNYEK